MNSIITRLFRLIVHTLIGCLLAAAVGASADEPPFVEVRLQEGGSAFAGVVPGPNGLLYGVTYDGGTSNYGTLYSIDAALSGDAVVRHNFDGTDGRVPRVEM